MSANAVPIITCKGISKRFQAGDHTVSALLNIDLEVSPGEFVVLLGPSGCGKSTLLYIMGGHLAPSDGELRMHEQPIAGHLVDNGLDPKTDVRIVEIPIFQIISAITSKRIDAGVVDTIFTAAALKNNSNELAPVFTYRDIGPFKNGWNGLVLGMTLADLARHCARVVQRRAHDIRDPAVMPSEAEPVLQAREQNGEEVSQPKRGARRAFFRCAAAGHRRKVAREFRDQAAGEILDQAGAAELRERALQLIVEGDFHARCCSARFLEEPVDHLALCMGMAAPVAA